ncbi:MAG: hypothetical protein O2807_12645 [bacterium]|nr:hypothetical protein [bacterium]
MTEEQERAEGAPEEMPEVSWPFYVFLVGIIGGGILGFLAMDALGVSLTRFRQFALGGMAGVVAVELLLRLGFRRRVYAWSKMPSFVTWLVILLYFLIFGENDPIGNLLKKIF